MKNGLKKLGIGLIAACLSLPSSADTPKEDLELTIRPLESLSQPQDFFGSYVPLSDGSVIDFSSWMALKYGLSLWQSDAALLDQSTGRTALTVYGIARATPQEFDEDAYSFKPQLPGCGLLTKVLWGKSKCQPDWQLTVASRVGNGVIAPQMVGIVDFNPFNAVTPADAELGRIQLGPPPTVLSMVP
ncbi:MAG: hypothetical protein AAF607_03760 [Pseudomonadota bacterium]